MRSFTMSARAAALSFAAVMMLSLTPSAEAATTIVVSLWDKGAAMDMPAGLGINMSGDMSKATMGIKATPDKAKAGVVTFKVTNDSKDTIHEMLVFPLKSETAQLPFVAAENKIEEEGFDLGEVSELDPGATGALTLNLKPGKYALICNVAGHYMAGMWTIVTVAK